MDDLEPFSRFVSNFIDDYDSDSYADLSDSERKEARNTQRAIDSLVEDIVTCRETLTDAKFRRAEIMVRDLPKLVRHFLDERFTRRAIQSVHGYVERTLQLAPLEGAVIPSRATNAYLQEAVRTYIFGLPQASVALSRAALEQALKESLGYQEARTFVEMGNLLDEAEGAQVIDYKARKNSRYIATQADRVLHEKPTSIAIAFEVLAKLREVLKHIYR